LFTNTNYHHLSAHDNDGDEQDRDEQMDVQSGGMVDLILL
jgi:hypothetical protein